MSEWICNQRHILEEQKWFGVSGPCLDITEAIHGQEDHSGQSNGYSPLIDEENRAIIPFTLNYTEESQNSF